MTELTPYAHQITGANALANAPAMVLADVPGLGKTISCVMAADKIGARHILVLAPAALKNHWANTFEQWGQIDRNIIAAPGIPKRIERQSVTIVSHAAMVKPENAAMFAAAGPWDCIILDEAHELRSMKAMRTINTFGQLDYALWRSTEHLWCLTGTPIVSSAHDLFPLYSSVLVPWMPEQANDYEFREHFTFMSRDKRGELKSRGVQRLDELVSRFKPFILRRTLDSVGIKLPPLFMQTVEVDIPVSVVASMLDKLGGAGVTPEYLEYLVENGDPESDKVLTVVRHALGIAKIPFALNRIIQLLRSGAGPIVAFFHHTGVRQGLLQQLNELGYRVSYIDGSVSPRQLKLAQEQFQAGLLDVLLVQTQAGGMGLTLTRANYELIVEPPWTAMALEQMAKRIHRITQMRGCLVETLLATNVFVDPIMARVVEAKAITAEQILQPFTVYH